MRTEQPKEYPTQGIHKKEVPGNNGYDPVAILLSEIIQTREVRTIIANAVPEILNAWAGNNFAKKITTRAIGKNVKHGLSRPEDILGQSELPKVFRKPDRIENLAEQLPKMLDVLFDLANEVGEGMEGLPSEEKQKVLGKLLTALFAGRTGKIITTWARVLSSTESDSPGFLNKLIEPGVTKWIENTDFGELKELLNSVSDISGETVKMVNDAIWKYPAKVVLLVSFLPAIANILVKTINESLGRFNNLAPDLVADVVLSCLRDIDAKNLGQTINEFSELIRKLDTGSSLIGDSGVSGFNREISNFVDTFASSVDIEKLFRAREGIAAGKETVSTAIVKNLKKNPNIILESIRRSQLLYNPAIKTLGQKAALVCDLPEKETSDAFSKTLSQLNFSEIAEIINLTSLLINRLRNHDNKLLPSIVSQIVDSLDMYEIEDSVSGILGDISESIKPLGRIILPNLVTMACDWLSPEENTDEPAMEEAREAIHTLLQPKEVQL